jgi:hypothetical protein
MDKAESSSKNSFTLGVGGVGRARPVRGDVPFQNHETSPRSDKRGRGKVRGAKSHFWLPRPPLRSSVFECILLPAPLNCACSVKLLKKVNLTIPRIRRRERRTEKNYFAPPPQPYPLRQLPGTDMLSATQAGIHRPSLAAVRAREVPEKRGRILGNPQKNSPIFGGIAKKRYHRVAGAEPHHLRWSRRNRPPGASAARTRKTT